MNEARNTETIPDELKWLADAPLFIDADQVNRFYDAVVRPDFRYGPTVAEDQLTETGRFTGKAGGELGAEVGGGALQALAGLFPGLAGGVLGVLGILGIKGSAKLNAGVEGYVEGSQRNLSRFEYQPIYTPQRDLVWLSLHYWYNQRSRLLRPKSVGETGWREDATISALPRALVFLDLPGQRSTSEGAVPTKLVPMAAEFENGKVVLLFDQIRSKDGRWSPPEYPDNDDPGFQAKQRDYWQWFDDEFDATAVMQVVETAASENGRIRWIDFRLPITSEGDTAHLHFVPAGGYDTGVFAYNLIKRGYRHGLRIVATVKSGPDLNVLAVYEK